MTQTLSRGASLADAASRFIGVRFQLNGRDPRRGLDCIGLIACSLEVIGEKPVVPEGYSLRNSDPSRWFNCAELSGFERESGPFEAGDVLLIKPGPGQHHLMIAANQRDVIHAHAGLRRVVRQPIVSATKFLAHWRLRTSHKRTA